MWGVIEEGTGADVIHGNTTTVPEKDDRPRTSKSSLDTVRASVLVKFPEHEHTVLKGT